MMTCNIYRDMGYPDADEMLVKCDLAISIEELLRLHGVTSDRAAKIIGVKALHLESVLLGHFRNDSVDSLREWLRVLRASIDPVLAPRPGEPKNPGEFHTVPPLIIT